MEILFKYTDRKQKNLAQQKLFEDKVNRKTGKGTKSENKKEDKDPTIVGSIRNNTMISLRTKD